MKTFRIKNIIVVVILASISILVLNNLRARYSIHISNKNRQANFPVIVEKCQVMPHRDSLYVFIMAGQSNMAGRALVEAVDTISNRRIITVDSSMNWIFAKEPLHYYEPNQTGLDCGMSFAQTLLDSIPEPITIALIPCAVGGSSIHNWLSSDLHRGVVLLDNVKKNIEFARNYGQIKGVIWHQGESDASPSVTLDYANNLELLITAFRSMAGDEALPILLGTLSDYADPKNLQLRWDSINQEINKVAKADKRVFVVDTHGLYDKGDKVHLNSESQRKLGVMYAEEYLEAVRAIDN